MGTTYTVTESNQKHGYYLKNRDKFITKQRERYLKIKARLDERTQK